MTTVQSKKRSTTSKGANKGASKATSTKKTTPKKKVNRTSTVPEIAFRGFQTTDLPWIVEITQKELGTIYQAAYQEPLAPIQVEQLVNMAQQATIILSDQQPVGYYTYFSDLSLKRHVSSLVLDKAKQRCGIGTRVMQEIETQAKKDGIQVLEVFIQSTNEPCLAFIQRLGYQRVQTPYLNTVCYQKTLK